MEALVLECGHVAFVHEVPEGSAECRRCDRTFTIKRLAEEADAEQFLTAGELVTAADIYLIARRRRLGPPVKEPKKKRGRKKR